jgi:hypothetical protein
MSTFAESNGKLDMKVSVEVSVNWLSRCSGAVPHSRVLWQEIKRDVHIRLFMRNIILADNNILVMYVVRRTGR